MIKTIIISSFLALTWNIGFAQKRPEIDSLKRELAYAKHDTTRLKTLIDLCALYIPFQKDSCQFYGNKALEIAKRLKDKRSEAHALIDLSISSRIYGDAPHSLHNAFKGLEIAESNNYTLEIARAYYSIGVVYGDILNDNLKAINYFKLAQQVTKKSEEIFPGMQLNRVLDLNIGKYYLEANKLDSALFYLQKLITSNDPTKRLYAIIELYWSELQFKLGNMDAAMEASDKAVKHVKNWGLDRSKPEVYFSRATLFDKQNKPDSSIYYAKNALLLAEKIGYTRIVLLASQLLADEYEAKDKEQSIYYHKLAREANDNFYGKKKFQEIQRILADEQERKKVMEAERIAYQNQLKQYAFGAGLGMLFLIAFILYRNNLQKQKANKVLETTLTNLKATQSQLIQSEKMASLGELTAGIAHEIQNPLNFVNNFSEVSSELIDEMKTELETGNLQLATEISNDLKQNLEKINHHGKRAADIVKGMLQHSRSSSGVKEPTNINALADEYLRLAYHGLRAKDKSFNATMKTDFDESIGNINIIPQDIGRVILNLITNAFYAVNERQKLLPTSHELLANFEPTVSISTKKEGNKVLISVKDNGNGIPQKILDKIFQPFFTTKPTGQGTGLGLSLSYDIVKAHGGELKVETLSAEAAAQAGNESEGSTFIIWLPMV